MTKLTRLYIENYKRIECIDVEIGPNVTEISGRNGAGKSSTLDAIENLIVGQSAAPEKPIRTGTNKAIVKGTFGDLLVERRFERDKYNEITRRLRISRGKESFASTEAQLRELIGSHMLDPGDFIKLEPRKKFEAMQIFVPDVDFKKLSRENKADYERRTDVNRLANEARAAANMIIVPKDTPDEEIDVSAGLRGLTKAAEHNAGIERLYAIQRARESERERLLADAKALREHAEKLRDEATEAEDRAACLIASSERVQAKIEEVASQIPTPVDLDAMRIEINKAQEINVNVRKKQEVSKHIALAVSREKESEDLTTQMQAREKIKQQAIANANLPVPGLTFGDEEVFLNGEPFEQASTAEKMTVGVALACARNPNLRLIWVRDASLLDDEHYNHLVELSKRFDCQILLETVRSIGDDVIELEDGKVRKTSED